MKIIETNIINKLTHELHPSHLDVINESPNHHVPEGAETHFKVIIVSPDFTGLSLVKRHQKIYAQLREEMNQGLHALSINAYSPEEWDKNIEKSVPETPACRGGKANEMNLGMPKVKTE